MGLVHVGAFSMLPRQNPKGVRVNDMNVTDAFTWNVIHIANLRRA